MDVRLSPAELVEGAVCWSKVGRLGGCECVEVEWWGMYKVRRTPHARRPFGCWAVGLGACSDAVWGGGSGSDITSVGTGVRVGLLLRSFRVPTCLRKMVYC